MVRALRFQASSRFYEGWVVVGAAALIVTMVGSVFFYGFPLLFTPVKDEFGWSHTDVSLAFALRTEAGGLFAPLVGLAADRYGARRVIVAGVLIMTAGLAAISLMTALWQFYIAMIVIAIGTDCAGGQVGMIATATWFERLRSRAMSVMTTGGGMAGLLVPGIAVLIDTLGWRDALRVMVVLVVATGVPLALLVRNRPEEHPQAMDNQRAPLDGEPARLPMLQWGVPPKTALLSRSFIFLALCNVGFGFGTTAIIVHQVPFLESIGMSSTGAGIVVAAFAVISVVGRLGFGYFGDKYDKRIVLAIAMALATAGMPLLAISDAPWQAIAALILLAPGFGGAIPLRAALVADNFGTRYFGTINGLLFATMTVGAFFGPLVMGILVDRTDSYSAGWLVSAAFTAFAVPFALAATRPTALIAKYQDLARAG